jgi:hypothetical protein
MTTPDSNNEPDQGDEPKNAYASPSVAASSTIKPAPRRSILLSALGWLFAIVGTIGTVSFALLAGLLFVDGRNVGWVLFQSLSIYAIAYFGGIFGMLAVLSGGSPGKADSFHVMPAVSWTLAGIIACEFAFFIVCTAANGT